MSKYDRFEDFMQTVLNGADALWLTQYGKSLADAYDVQRSIVEIIRVIIFLGWWAFVVLAALLGLGAFIFAASLAAFIMTPIGLVITAGLAAFGGVAAVKSLYRNRALPLAVRETGEMYKAEFVAHMNDCEYVDRLIERAS